MEDKLKIVLRNQYTSQDIKVLRELVKDNEYHNLYGVMPQLYYTYDADNFAPKEITEDNEPQVFLMNYIKSLYPIKNRVPTWEITTWGDVWGLIFYTPLDDVPMYVNNKGLSLYARWRLEIRK